MSKSCADIVKHAHNYLFNKNTYDHLVNNKLDLCGKKFIINTIAGNKEYHIQFLSYHDNYGEEKITVRDLYYRCFNICHTKNIKNKSNEVYSFFPMAKENKLLDPNYKPRSFRSSDNLVYIDLVVGKLEFEYDENNNIRALVFNQVTYEDIY